MRVLLFLLLLALGVPAQAQEAEQGTRKGSERTYPPFDGSNNNAQHPTWGRKNTPFIHKQVANKFFEEAHAGSTDGMTGANRPSARAITLALLNKPYFKAVMNSSALASALGQLVSQDINRGGSTAKGNGGPAPIKVPPGDPYMWRFDNATPTTQGSRVTIPFWRSNYTRATPTGPRLQINEATAWLDASCIYGETEQTAKLIRAGTAGRLLMDDDRLLPFNKQTDSDKPKYTMRNGAERIPQTQLRLSGNANANQNPLLLSLTIVFVREHNRRARLIEDANPDWSDEKIFQEARRWVIGHFQRVALVDYMSAIELALPPYKGYNASLDPSIDTFFTVVAYRYGHATINDVVFRLDSSWSTHPKGHLMMAEAYYNPNVALEAGLEALLRGMIAQPKAKVEPRWSLAMAGNFAGHSTINGTDIPAINIQRGRDHGVPDYNTCRRAFGLPAAKTFSDITPDEEVAAILKQLYGNVNNIDPYVGGLAEPADGGAHFGPLFAASIKEQFLRLRDADWWYFENGAKNKLYSEAEMQEIRSTSLRDILARTTSIKDLPSDIWSASNSMTCAAGSSGLMGANTGGRNKLLLPGLLGGSTSLMVEPGSEPGWLKVQMTSSGSGWLGFGVADAGSDSPMIGADMVVGHAADGIPTVKRYQGVAHQPPTEMGADEQTNRLRNIKFEQANGKVSLEFERPAAGGGGSDRAMPVNRPLRLIVARGPNNDISSLNGYHGTSKEIVELNNGMFGAAALAQADPKAITRRRAHGILMALNFIIIFPLGALAARQLRCHWITNPRVRAAMFYVHICTQVAGVALATAGFIIATRWFGVPYNIVMFSHGKMGVAILVLVYSQLLLGFLRPTATASANRRHVWDVVHSTVGRASMIAGMVNVGLGVVIFCFTYAGDFSTWAGVCAAGLGAITLLQYVCDRQEKYAVIKNDREMLMLKDHAGGCAEDGLDKDGNIGGMPSQALTDGGSWHHEVQQQPGPRTSEDRFQAPPPGDAAAAGGVGFGAAPPAAAAGAADFDFAPEAAGYGSMQPAPARASAAGASGGRSPKLTATLLQRHEASAGGQEPNNVGVSHRDFVPNGLQTGHHGDVGRTEWDQQAMQAHVQQHQMQQQQHQMQQPPQPWPGHRSMG